MTNLINSNNLRLWVLSDSLFKNYRVLRSIEFCFNNNLNNFLPSDFSLHNSVSINLQLKLAHSFEVITQ